MRLDSLERAALMKATADVKGEIYIYGSRLDDTKKGGDIDVLIFSDEPPFKLSQEVAVKFFMECEEKIDVTVMDPDNLNREQELFLNVIKTERIK